jgi:hypothetical protein
MDDRFTFKTTITVPIRETLKEVDSNTWLIGPLLVSRSNGYCNTATWFDDGDNSSYIITDAPTPQPPATLLSPNNPYITQIHDRGDGSTVWAIGSKVLCKVHILFSLENITPEDVTLKWVQHKRPNFQVPEVLHSTTYDYRSILFLTRLPGRTLGAAWPSLTIEWRHYYIKAIADICQGMAEWKGGMISGVDGKNISEQFFIESKARGQRGPIDFSPAILEKACSMKIGMDCSSFVFYHADLGQEISL